MVQVRWWRLLPMVTHVPFPISRKKLFLTTGDEPTIPVFIITIAEPAWSPNGCSRHAVQSQNEMLFSILLHWYVTFATYYSLLLPPHMLIIYFDCNCVAALLKCL